MKISGYSGFFSHFTLFTLLFFSIGLHSQVKNTSYTKVIQEGHKVLTQTISEKNVLNNSLDNPLLSKKADGTRQVFGGNVIWSFQDAAAIADNMKLGGSSRKALVGWVLNDERASLYGDGNNTPVWEYPVGDVNSYTGISDDGAITAITNGTSFMLMNPTTGAIAWQYTVPDTFNVSYVAVSRDGSKAAFVSTGFNTNTLARAYVVNLSGSQPAIQWSFDIPVSEITNWAGVSFSADGSRVIFTGRKYLYIYNTSTGSLVWKHFVDNTESPAVLSSDGKILASADLSGFVQARLFNSSTNEYDLLWQYKIPAGTSTSWASAIGISANGQTIVAGSLIFTATGYDGSIIAFDTYGGGTPKWIYTGTGDEVSDVSISDDGKVAAVATWGDLDHAKPDLYVFDVATGDTAFTIRTPGSFETVDLSHDGKRVIAGGKAVHDREMGSGGLLYFANIDLGGGTISGTVTLTGDKSGVTVKAEGTTRTAVTDASGNYSIANVPAGTYAVSASKPGYNFGGVTGVSVTSGGTTSNINFNLGTFSTTPPALTATTNLMRTVRLNFPSALSDMARQNEFAKAVGDPYVEEGTHSNVKSAVGNNSVFSGSSIFSPGRMVDSIAIYRSPVAGGPYIRLNAVIATESFYNDSTALPLKNYYYVINLFNAMGQSIYSAEAYGKVSDTLLTFNFESPDGTVPVIDGVISAGEWDDAVKVDISDIFGYGGGVPRPQGSSYAYVKYDSQTKMLYIAGDNTLDTELNSGEGFGIYVDDNDDKAYGPSTDLPILYEGNYWAYWYPTGANLRFRQIFTGGAVGTVDTLTTDGDVEFSTSSGHVQCEVAIPLGFEKGHQIQIYGPGNNVGIGMFFRDGANYYGWWPQTMNSVFSAQYFADVKVNTMLTAPPKAPASITATSQNNGITVTWADPTQGLNNWPLTTPAKIKIYKNGEYLATVANGVQTFTDNNVTPKLWYSYSLKAFTVTGSDTLFSVMSPSYGSFAALAPTLIPISYDDGTYEGLFYVSGGANDKFAVRFTPSFYPSRIVRLKATVNYSTPFDFTINSDSSGVPGSRILAGPFTATSGSNVIGDAVFTLPGTTPPIIEEGDFWVLFNYRTETPTSPAVGVDQSSTNTGRSMFYVEGQGWANFTYGNVMITAYAADTTTVTPVELTSFTASASGKSVNLLWSTATEKNNKGFEVEKYDGSKWNMLGYVNGNGTSTEKHDYAFTDKNLNSGKYSYRLKQIDYDGSYAYSQVAEANVVAVNQFSLAQNYPNPFNPVTVINYQLAKDEQVTLEVFNSLGEKVASLINEKQEAGDHSVQWNAKNAPSGMYIYRIQAGSFTSVKKMVLLK